jgi:NADH-quinone oxidoreductase subunit L
MLDFIFLVPLLPLLGFLLNGILNKRLSKNVAAGIGVLSVAGSFAIASGIFFQSLGQHNFSHTIQYCTWLKAGSLTIPFEFLVDSLSILFMLIVTGVGLLIHIYSVGYMHDDEGFNRFFAYLNLFMFSMLMLVLGANYVMMFVGWEGVGLCSYLLIGFWYKNQDYNSAAKKAFVMNRIGDLGFLAGMFLLFSHFGSLSFSDIFEKAKSLSTNDTTVIAITLLLFIGATGKSAQIPLFTWLPDAMAGPTPVSALIHAATMVTAGIYMIARSNVLYTLAPATLEVILVIGLLTALLGSIIALTQRDIKKVLAYSTVSQLGYMFIALGLGNYNAAVFHVMTHAFFKALLFLGAGSVIHAMSGEQDIFKMGGLRKHLPVTNITFFIATAAISGFPLLTSGFYSKDEIFVSALAHSPWLWLPIAILFFLTPFYMFRLYFLTFYGEFRGTQHQLEHLHESPRVMTVPLLILAFLSIIGGFVNATLLGSLTNIKAFTSLEHFLQPVFRNYTLPFSHAENHFIEYSLLIASILMIVFILWITYNLFAENQAEAIEEEEMSLLQKLSYNKLYVDEIYALLIQKPLDWLSEKIYEFVEVSGIDQIVNASGNFVLWGSRTLRMLQTGHIGFYLFAMVFGIIMILVFNFII